MTPDPAHHRHPLSLLRAAVRDAAHRRRRRRGVGRRRGTSRPTAAVCARRAGRPRRCCAPRTGSPRRWYAGTAGCEPAELGRGARRGGRPGPARCRPSTAGTRRGVRRRRPHQREGLPARQVRPGRAAAPGTSTTTAGSACPSAAAAATGRSASTAACRSRSTDLAGAQAVLLLGSNVADTMPPLVQHLAGVRRRGGLVVVDPRRSATAALTDADGRRACTCSRCPGTDLVLLLGLLHLLVASATSSTDDYLERAHDRLGRRPPVGGVLVAAAGRRTSPASPSRCCGGPPSCWPRPRPSTAAPAPMVLTGRGVEQHRDGTRHGRRRDQPGAGARAARPSGLRLRLPHRPGQRPGRPRARPEVPTSSPATAASATRPRARTSPACGASTPDVAPGCRRAGGRAARQARRRGQGAARARQQPRRSARPNAARRAPPAASRSTCSSSATSCPSETAELADVVLPVTQWAEEEGTMTNLEGRVLRRRQAVDAPDGVRSELEVLADLAARLGCPAPFADGPGRGLRRARPGPAPADAPTTRASATPCSTSEPTAAAHHWPVPVGRHGHPAAVRRPASPTPDGRARLVPVTPRRPADDLRPDAPRLPGHRPGAGAVPVRAPRPAGSPALEPRRARAVRRAPPAAGVPARGARRASRSR